MRGGDAAAAASVLDDLDARPGSATSLLRTIIGLYLRPLGGTISSAALVDLLGALGISAAAARTAITRVKQKGLLLPDAAGFALNPAAVPMLERGDRRIFEVRQMRAGDAWCLVSFTVPEARRDVRHQARRRLQWIGCGAVAPSLWICPDHLAGEVEQILDELGIRALATLFRTEDPRPGASLADAAAMWWDLDALRAEHLRFQETLDALPEDEPFAAYVRLIDSWRPLPYIDPGLPASLLPAGWPGQRSFDGFATREARWSGPAWSHVHALVSRSDVTHESPKTG